MAETMKELLTQEELMRLLKISRATLFRWRRAGLPTVKVGRTVRFDQDAVNQWIRERAGSMSR